MTFPGLLIFDPLKSPWHPPGVGWVKFFLAENESHIYPNMYAKFGCGPTVVSKKGGVQTDRQRDTAALYSCPVADNRRQKENLVVNNSFLHDSGILILSMHFTVAFQYWEWV